MSEKGKKRKRIDFNEDFLHYVWRLKRFELKNLSTENDEEITIINGGTWNHDAGPDFLNAKIKIGETTWAGHVEIHIHSSDWIRHHHELDDAYQNVILHVVYAHDKEIKLADGAIIPTLSLKDKIEKDLYAKYLRLKDHQEWVPCQSMIGQTDGFTWSFWKDKLLVERLERKTAFIKKLSKDLHHDWEFLLILLVGRYLVGKQNADTVEDLLLHLGPSTVRKCSQSSDQITAVLLGMGGFLSDPKEEYIKKLDQEYRFLKSKYELSTVILPWKYMRMRPSAFPDLRVAQLAAILSQSPRLFSRVIENLSANEIAPFFEINLHQYWDDHYRIGQSADKSSKKKIGKTTIQSILINAIAPLLFYYGIQKDRDDIKQKAIGLLHNVPKENNVITRNWKDLGVTCDHAGDSQSLIQLKTEYCAVFRCLHCDIGHKLLR